MGDRYDDKADMSVRGRLGSQAGSQKMGKRDKVTKMDEGKVCKNCGAKYAPGTAGDEKSDCPMC